MSLKKRKKIHQNFTPKIYKEKPQKVKNPIIITNDHRKYEKFMSYYDDGSMEFPDTNFRKGAKITGTFGLESGFRTNSAGKMIWGYVRSHSGVDRAHGKSYKGIDDIVMSPFDFHRSRITTYGNKSYGSLIQLFQDEYEFEMRIAHMNPKTNIISWTLKQLKAQRPIKRDWFFGSAGNYGYSTGAHTHTEIKSYDERCEVLEILLEELFGDKSLKEYTTGQILKFYKKQPKFINSSDRVIIDDWSQIKKIKKIYFANKYMTRYIDFDDRPKTRYSSNLLFNGL